MWHLMKNAHIMSLEKRREKLDYIFLTFELYDRFDSSFIWDDVKNGIYLSDHYPTGIVLED